VQLVRTLLVVAVVVGSAFAPTAQALAAPSDTGVSVANFSESRGCRPEVSGVPKPKTIRTGSLDAGEVIYGPWGDLIGRTKAQVQGSLVQWRIAGTNRTVPIHERAYPAARTVDKNLAAAAARFLSTVRAAG